MTRTKIIKSKEYFDIFLLISIKGQCYTQELTEVMDDQTRLKLPVKLQNMDNYQLKDIKNYGLTKLIKTINRGRGGRDGLREINWDFVQECVIEKYYPNDMKVLLKSKFKNIKGTIPKELIKEICIRLMKISLNLKPIKKKSNKPRIKVVFKHRKIVEDYARKIKNLDELFHGVIRYISSDWYWDEEGPKFWKRILDRLEEMNKSHTFK